MKVTRNYYSNGRLRRRYIIINNKLHGLSELWWWHDGEQNIKNYRLL